MGEFVPVKVDAEDGEGRPLINQYQAHVRGYPAFCSSIPLLRPEGQSDRRQNPGLRPTGLLHRPVEHDRETTEGRPNAPRGAYTAHPKDMNGLRTLVTALTMQGQTKEAIELASRANAARPKF